MATLQKIRDKGPLIAIVIGFALLAFILGDLVSNTRSLFGSSGTTLGEVNGEKIGIKEFQSSFNNYKAFIQTANGSGSNFTQEQEKQIRNATWDNLLKDKLLNEDLKDMGLWVSDLEVSELITGQNINELSPIVKGLPIFMNPQTRQVSLDAIRNFFLNAKTNDAYRDFSLYLEDLVRKNQASTKLLTLVSKGLNVSTFDAKQKSAERLNTIDFEYVYKNYNTIKDADIKVSESEIEDYYAEHKKDFEQEMSRGISYVSFNIRPSREDYAETKNDMLELKKELTDIDVANDEEIINFVNVNSDEPFFNKYYAKGEYKVPNIDSLLWNATAGDIVGPFEQGGAFKMAILMKASTLVPDTVEASHIIIAPNAEANVSDMDRAEEIIDSLKVEIENGADFAELAKKHSLDSRSADKGGDLGEFTEAQMPKSISDVCFYGNVGDIKKVKTQYGWHLIKITKQSEKKEKIFPIILSRQVLAGEKTLDMTYNKASKFASEVNSLESFDKKAQAMKLTVGVAENITPDRSNVTGIQNSGNVVSWMFREKTKLHSISNVFQNNDKFVVAILTNVKEKGIAPLKQVSDEIKPLVIKEKKADMIKAEFETAIGDKKNLQQIATDTKANFGTEKGIAFSSSFIPKLGREGKVIGSLAGLKTDAVSKPIVGNNGVFIVKVTKVNTKSEIAATEVEKDKLNAQRTIAYKANQLLLEALKKQADIKDNRYKFF